MPPMIERRKERLAVNLFDLDRLEPTVRIYLTSGKVDFKKPVRVDESIQSTAVPFRCPLLEAATACDVLQSEQRKVGLEPVKLYIDRGDGNWVRLAATAQLTVVHAGRVLLNPLVFGKEVLGKEKGVALEPTKLF